MSQVTIYLPDELAERMRRAAESEGVSQSRWIARLIDARLARAWPQEVLALVGSWPKDFPDAEQIRRGQGSDLPRESD